MSDYSVRIIKSENCWICKRYIPQLTKSGLQFELFDGDALENAALLDGWKIESFPVIQILDKDKNVAYQFPSGTFSNRSINFKLDEISKKAKDEKSKSGTTQSN